ncbi:MAG: hypothetical protein Q9218_001880 [Villophora microphyllina]
MNATIPALQPPAGILSNFENPENRAYITVIPCAAIVGVMIIFVFIRMYTKVYTLKSVGWDDYTCVFAAISSVVYLGVLMALYQYGYGVHQWNITYKNYVSLLSKEGKCIAALWSPLMFFTKLSLLLLYYQIFAPDRVTKYLVYVGILYCFVLYTSSLLLTFLLCQTMLTPSCKLELNHFIWITTGLNVLGDVYLLIIPLSAVAKLHLPPRQKLGASAVFFAGLLACSSGILALYYRVQLLYTKDLTWNASPVVIFTVLEINVGIIVSCMPTFPAFIQDIRHQVIRSRKASQKSRSASQKSRSTGQKHRSRHPSSKVSKQLPQQKKVSDQSTRSTVKHPLPQNHRISPVELEANPVKRAEVHLEPRSYFSDDSSDLEAEHYHYHYRRREAHESYGWLR